EAAAAAQDAELAVEVALLADGLAQGRLEAPRVDDGVVQLPLPGLAALVPADVQLAGAVAALAADGVTTEDGLPVAVDGVLDRLGPVGVAEHAHGHDRAVEVGVVLAVAGRQVPGPPGGVPADRRLEEAAVLLDQVAVPARAGADDVAHLRRPPARAAGALPVGQAPAAQLHLVVQPLRLEGA